MIEPITPISKQLAEQINKVNEQYKDGAITANELCCKIHSILIEQIDSVIKEYETEQAYWETHKHCTCDGTSQKQMECSEHGISAQLNRTQME